MSDLGVLNSYEFRYDLPDHHSLWIHTSKGDYAFHVEDTGELYLACEGRPLCGGTITNINVQEDTQIFVEGFGDVTGLVFNIQTDKGTFSAVADLADDEYFVRGVRVRLEGPEGKIYEGELR